MPIAHRIQIWLWAYTSPAGGDVFEQTAIERINKDGWQVGSFDISLTNLVSLAAGFAFAPVVDCDHCANNAEHDLWSLEVPAYLDAYRLLAHHGNLEALSLEDTELSHRDEILIPVEEGSETRLFAARIFIAQSDSEPYLEYETTSPALQQSFKDIDLNQCFIHMLAASQESGSGLQPPLPHPGTDIYLSSVFTYERYGGASIRAFTLHSVIGYDAVTGQHTLQREGSADTIIEDLYAESCEWMVVHGWDNPLSASEEEGAKEGAYDAEEMMHFLAGRVECVLKEQCAVGGVQMGFECLCEAMDEHLPPPSYPAATLNEVLVAMQADGLVGYDPYRHISWW